MLLFLFLSSCEEKKSSAHCDSAECLSQGQSTHTNHPDPSTDLDPDDSISQTPILSGVAFVTYGENTPKPPLYFVNSGSDIVSCTILPSLPPGLIIEAISGSCQISGTPTETRSETEYLITGLAEDGSLDSLIITITVRIPIPPQMAAVAPQVYTNAVNFPGISIESHGDPIVSCSISPSLPSGLSMEAVDGECRIVGVPLSAQGATDYVITAKGIDGSEDSIVINMTFSINEAPSLADIVLTQVFTKNIAITPVDFSNSGGAIVTCDIQPNLPDGLILTVADHSCRISGTPTTGSSETEYTLTVEASDGGSDSATVSIFVQDPPVFAAVSDPFVFVLNEAMTPFDFTNSGANIVSCAVNPPLPAGVSLAVENGTCQISGTPTELVAEVDYTITATASDNSTTTIMISATVEEGEGSGGASAEITDAFNGIVGEQPGNGTNNTKTADTGESWHHFSGTGSPWWAAYSEMGSGRAGFSNTPFDEWTTGNVLHFGVDHNANAYTTGYYIETEVSQEFKTTARAFLTNQPAHYPFVGFVFRYHDTNNMLIAVVSSYHETAGIYKRENGSWSTVAEELLPWALDNYTVLSLELTVSGASLSFRAVGHRTPYEGSGLLGVVNVSTSSTFNQTATKHGVFASSYNTIASGGDPEMQDFVFTTISE